MKAKLALALLTMTVTTGVQAENYLSLGQSRYEAKGEKFDGLNIVYSGVGSNGMGWIIQPQWVENDENGVEQKLLNASFGFLLSPSREDMIRIYPLLGVAYYSFESNTEKYDRLWPSVGAGLQVQVPKTSFFLDTSYKRVFTVGRDRDIDAISLGVGYRW